MEACGAVGCPTFLFLKGELRLIKALLFLLFAPSPHSWKPILHLLCGVRCSLSACHQASRLGEPVTSIRCDVFTCLHANLSGVNFNSSPMHYGKMSGALYRKWMHLVVLRCTHVALLSRRKLHRGNKLELQLAIIFKYSIINESFIVYEVSERVLHKLPEPTGMPSNCVFYLTYKINPNIFNKKMFGSIRITNMVTELPSQLLERHPLKKDIQCPQTDITFLACSEIWTTIE